jgi:hypothetical protein
MNFRKKVIATITGVGNPIGKDEVEAVVRLCEHMEIYIGKMF